MQRKTNQSGSTFEQESHPSAPAGKFRNLILRAASLIPEDRAPGWILRRAKRSVPAVAATTLCTCLYSILSVYTALVMREAVDYATDLDRQGFLHWALVFLAIVLAEIAANALTRQLEEYVKATVENALKEQVYASVLNSEYGALKSFHTGELLNRMTNDTKVVADQVALLVPGCASMAVRLVSALAVLIVIDWRFGCIFLAGGLILFVITLLFRRRLKTMHKSIQEADGRLRAWLTESLESIPIIKSFEAEPMAEKRIEKLAEEHKKERMRRITFSNLCNIGFGAIMQGSYLFGFIWCGMGILSGSLSYGTLTAVLSLVSQIRSPLANISGYVPRYYSMTASAERLMELEQLPKESAAGVMADIQAVTGPEETASKPQDRHPKKEVSGKKNFVSRGAKEKAVPQDGRCPGIYGKQKDRDDIRKFHEIRALHLNFDYGDGEHVLWDVSFRICRGEIVALTGISGIGKSTLLKLLLGIYQPTAGDLYHISENGQEKTVIGPATRAWFSYVPQGNMLLSGSIYEAVDFLHAAPYTPEQKEKIREACRIACADEFIRALPDGYDTVLGEKGSGLSEGQMQRISVARAIYRHAPVLLLDEATSALDEDTETRLLENLKELRDQTVLIVTHRPAALKICTKQLLFDKNGVYMKESM